jgi:hypothetical protein
MMALGRQSTKTKPAIPPSGASEEQARLGDYCFLYTFNQAKSVVVPTSHVTRVTSDVIPVTASGRAPSGTRPLAGQSGLGGVRVSAGPGQLPPVDDQILVADRRTGEEGLQDLASTGGVPGLSGQ